MNPLNRFRFRLSSKIALVFFLSLLAILMLHMVTIRTILGPKRFPAMTRIGIDHARYMVEEIGQPPNLDKARELHDRLGIQIRIEGDRVSWVSNPDMIRFKDISLSPLPDQPNARAEFTPFGFCIEITREKTRFMFVLHPRQENIREIGTTFLLILIFYTALVLFIMYFVISWLLRDVRILSEGMERIGSGQLDHRMSTRRQDELGRLVHSFNTMSGKIQDMILRRDRLLLDVSHELRSPLTRIKLSLEMMDGGEGISALQDDVNELEKMIAELLEGERLASPHGGLKRVTCSLTDLLDEIKGEFADRKPGIRVHTPADSPSLVMDPVRMKIALRNLIDNGLRYSDEQGQAVDITVEEEADEILLTVTDHGQGIPPADLPHIFEPFYRVDKSRSKETGGYGLGLNLVHKIITAHGGRIEAQSRVGEGTRVVIYLKKLGEV
jgi:signal transduction histidine kinase